MTKHILFITTFANDLALQIPFYIGFQLAVVLGTSTVKDTLIPTARNPLATAAVPDNVETLSYRIAAQSISAVV
jgi:hypothetical protein